MCTCMRPSHGHDAHPLELTHIVYDKYAPADAMPKGTFKLRPNRTEPHTCQKHERHMCRGRRDECMVETADEKASVWKKTPSNSFFVRVCERLSTSMSCLRGQIPLPGCVCTPGRAARCTHERVGHVLPGMPIRFFPAPATAVPCNRTLDPTCTWYAKVAGLSHGSKSTPTLNDAPSNSKPHATFAPPYTSLHAHSLGRAWVTTSQKGDPRRTLLTAPSRNKTNSDWSS